MTLVVPPPIELNEGRQGHYAGAVSRLVAFVIDILAIWGLYLLFAAGLSLASQLVSGNSFTLAHHQLAGSIVLVVWGFVYFSYQWALNGKTIGMALFGLQWSGSTAAMSTAATPPYGPWSSPSASSSSAWDCWASWSSGTVGPSTI